VRRAVRMARCASCAFSETTLDECTTSDGVTDDASAIGANGRRKFFGAGLESWAKLDAAGVIRARFVGVREVENCTFECSFACDVAHARARARVVAAGEEARATALSGGAAAADEIEVVCAFDAVDLSSVIRHDALNVGAFEVIARTRDGEELARAALLTRVEQDESATLRRLVLPYVAKFE